MARDLVEDTETSPSKQVSPARRKRRWLLGFAVTAVALAVGVVALERPRYHDAIVSGLLALRHPDAAVAAPPPPMVRTATVVAATGREARFTGVVHARYESALGFRVAGKILERLVDTGDRVRKDQPLMRLDPTDFALALRAAHSEADAARTSARQTASDEVRGRSLVDKGQLSMQGYEREKTAADAAAAKLAAAFAQERQAENQLAYVVLLADADGVVMETSGEPGQVVALGQPVVRLARDGAREAEVYIPESDRAASVGSAALYAEPDRWFPAKLREISVAADPLTRTFRARYRLEGAGRAAALGTTVTIRVARTMDDPPGVGVPAAALFDDGHGSALWVVDPASSTVAARSVRVLRAGDEDTVVAGDLAVGERVVALGAHLLEAGQKVTPARAPIDTAAR